MTMKLSVLVVGFNAIFLSAAVNAGEQMTNPCGALPAMISSSLFDFFSAIRTCAKDLRGSGAIYEIAPARIMARNAARSSMHREP